jgi:hypothetical protein
VARVLPGVIDGDAVIELDVQRHIESCLQCQAEVARYRKMLRGLHLLRTRYLEPAPGLLAQTLADLEVFGEREARRALLSGRRLAYASAVGVAAGAAGAAFTIVLVARSRRRGTVPAAN